MDFREKVLLLPTSCLLLNLKTKTMENELAKTSIFVADNAVGVKNIQELLREEGFKKISTITNGIKALNEIKKNKPEIIIANISLPKYTGLQIFKSTQTDKSLASIKFILTTSKLKQKELDEIKKQGVPNILQQPFSSGQLRELIFSIFGMGSELREDVAKDFFKQGMEYFEKGEFKKALEIYKNASTNYSEASYLFMQGRCYLELGQPDRAVVMFRKTTDIERNYPEIAHWRDIALKKRKEMVNATPETYIEKGKNYLNADMVKEADQSFNTAISLDPKNTENRTNIGNAYLENELYSKAEEAFGDAIAMSPKDIPLHNRMAIALRKQGRYKEAINIYFNALKIAPKDEGLYYNMARVLFESNQKERALKALDLALSIDPEFEEAKKMRAEYSK